MKRNVITAVETPDIMQGYRENCNLPRNVGKHSYKRILIGIPMTGTLRSEWVLSRYSQVIPCNWSQVETLAWLNQWSPIDFLVADARNIIVDRCVKEDFEWLLQIDHDVILPPHTFLSINDYMISGEVPFLSGLYFTKSKPAEPLIYRGRGNGHFRDWKMGDKVWVDGIPSGITLIHGSVLRVLWEESPEYEVSPGLRVREVYKTPSRVWYSPQDRSWFTSTGTEDLNLCTRIMEEDIFTKAGWPEIQEKEFPFLCDTSIFCRHITTDGVMYPACGEEIGWNK